LLKTFDYQSIGSNQKSWQSPKNSTP